MLAKRLKPVAKVTVDVPTIAPGAVANAATPMNVRGRVPAAAANVARRLIVPGVVANAATPMNVRDRAPVAAANVVRRLIVPEAVESAVRLMVAPEVDGLLEITLFTTEV